ncbi:MAG: phosphatase PAP2 family protein [Nitriliruptorales bacterium]|nr:phosphatase PAP2 family protein [Nitriliruptorales bacterium]
MSGPHPRSARTLVAATAALGTGWVVARTRPLHAAERGVSAAVRRRLPGRGSEVVGIATDLGSSFAVAGAAATLAALGRRERAIDVGVSGGLAWIAAQGAKPLLDRPRPYESDGAERLVAVPAGSSWPSGHAAVAAAMAVALSEDARQPAPAMLAGMSVFVAASRVHVGVHHPSDVIAGWGLGVLVANVWRLVRRPVLGLVGRLGRGD